MSTQEWFYLMAVVGGLLISLPLVRKLAIRTGASPEVSRKTVHVCMGLACLCFPWIFQSPLAVWILAFISSGLLFIMRCIPALRYGIGCTLHGVNRLSCGEILFAPAIATVFHIAHGEPVYYIIPVAILTVADAAGALAGKRWGRLRYACGDDHKTVEGSLAFLACAIACVFLPLYWLTDLTLLHMIAISIILALLTMIGEGISDRGFDNLILPIGALFILQRLIPLESDALITRLVALAILFFLVLWGSRWSTLNGSSLLGGALLIYGCAILGTWQYALPPIAVFMCHMLTSHTHKLTQRLVHSEPSSPSPSPACLGLSCM
jgi:phytol kinase